MNNKVPGAWVWVVYPIIDYFSDPGIKLTIHLRKKLENAQLIFCKPIYKMRPTNKL